MLALLRSTRTVMAVVVLATTGMLATQTVRIKPGDTLSQIATRHGVGIADLVALNDLADPDLILAGDTLIIRADTKSGDPVVHVVRAGDTLTILAGRFRSSVGALVALNRLADPDLIFVGQRLTVAGTAGDTAGDKAGDTAGDTAAPAPPVVAGDGYTVQPGDTLLGIARASGMRTVDLARANEITDPDRIFAGQLLSIPITDDAPPPSTSTAPPPPTTSAPPAPAPPTTTAPPPSTTVPPAAAVPPPITAPTTTTTLPTPAPGSGTGLVGYFDKWSAAYGIDRGLLEALLWKESSWRADAVGPGGHLGIGQLSPDTVAFVEERLLGLDLDPLDASDGIQMAARFLRYLRDRTETDRAALAAWNQGLHGVLTDGIAPLAGAFADDVLVIRQQRG